MYKKLPLASFAEMKNMDARTVALKDITSLRLMHDAASAAFDEINKLVDVTKPRKILVLCGGGNNGGDGFALCKMFSSHGHDVSVLPLKQKISSPDALHYYNAIADDDNIVKLTSNSFLTENFSFDIVIDAVYGTGFHGVLPSHVQEVFKKVHALDAVKIAIDLPSGVFCDDGRVCEGCFASDFTVTFEFLKPALVSYPAKRFGGVVRVVSIGFPDEVKNEVQQGGFYLSKSHEKSEPDRRDAESHKGDFGKMLMVCGSENMTGAPYFAAMGALRSGIGLLFAACPSKCHAVLATRLAEPIFYPYDNSDELLQKVGELSKYDVILHGCGSGLCSVDVTKSLIEKSKSPLILDADALRIVAERQWLLRCKTCDVVLTPHPGEMAALCGKTTSEVQSDRLRTAVSYAEKSGCIVVLKGAGTVIADPSGRFAVNESGNPGMAKGGSGDVLAGMIAARCVGASDIFEAVCDAVFAHGKAGDDCAKERCERSMLPSDMLEFI